MSIQKSEVYQSLEARWAKGEVTVMDGGIGSELQAMGYPPVDDGQSREGVNYTWGSMALYDAPEIVKAMHRRYVDAGAGILLTNTFLFHRCVALETDGNIDVAEGTWHQKAKLAVRLAREAAAEGGKPDTAVVFCMMIQDGPKEEWGYNGPSYERGTKEWEWKVPLDYLRELTGVLNEDPATRPDALLVELGPPIGDDLAFPHYEVLIESGIPLWVAYRRNASGPIGIFGEDQDSDGDRFGRAAQRFEEIGVQAVLAHCLPAEKAHGIAEYLRQYTALPLGVYPNNGRYDRWVWKWEHDHSADELAQHARGYASEGMSIIGGCCGTRPEHIAAIAAAVR